MFQLVLLNQFYLIKLAIISISLIIAIVHSHSLSFEFASELRAQFSYEYWFNWISEISTEHALFPICIHLKDGKSVWVVVLPNSGRTLRSLWFVWNGFLGILFQLEFLADELKIAHLCFNFDYPNRLNPAKEIEREAESTIKTFCTNCKHTAKTNRAIQQNNHLKSFGWYTIKWMEAKR